MLFNIKLLYYVIVINIISTNLAIADEVSYSEKFRKYVSDIKGYTTEKTLGVAEGLAKNLYDTLKLSEEIGFKVEQITIEISLSPKVVIILYDNGDTGKFTDAISGAEDYQATVLNLLQATRSFQVSGFKRRGVRLTTGAATPAVEIIAELD
ncbi:MAG: hypothetical protein KDJ69_00710 [Nitratireductor sp.]|nr:hypothetical protein [Nitratireductor sp.]